MNCPICQTKLESYTSTTYIDYETSFCPVGQNDKHNNTHYYKYVQGNTNRLDEIEEIVLYPFKIKNITMNYNSDSRLGKEDVEIIPAHADISCFLFKFNSQKFIQYKIDSGGFDQIIKLPYHIKSDTEDKLRARINILLLLS